MNGNSETSFCSTHSGFYNDIETDKIGKRTVLQIYVLKYLGQTDRKGCTLSLKISLA